MNAAWRLRNLKWTMTRPSVQYLSCFKQLTLFQHKNGVFAVQNRSKLDFEQKNVKI